MKEHDEHIKVTEHLISLAKKHNLTAVVAAAEAHLKAGHAAIEAHATNNPMSKIGATTQLLSTAADVGKALMASGANTPEEVVQAALQSGKSLGLGMHVAV